MTFAGQRAEESKNPTTGEGVGVASLGKLVPPLAALQFYQRQHPGQSGVRVVLVVEMEDAG